MIKLTRITISVRDWVFEKYLLNLKIKNKSKYIEEYLVKGIEADISNFSVQESKFIELFKDVRAKTEEIINLRRELALVKARLITQEKREAERKAIRDAKELKRKQKEDVENELREGNKMSKAIKMSGFIERIGMGDDYGKK